jgi:hypothetical protein
VLLAWGFFPFFFLNCRVAFVFVLCLVSAVPVTCVCMHYVHSRPQASPVACLATKRFSKLNPRCVCLRPTTLHGVWLSWIGYCWCARSYFVGHRLCKWLCRSVVCVFSFFCVLSVLSVVCGSRLLPTCVSTALCGLGLTNSCALNAH